MNETRQNHWIIPAFCIAAAALALSACASDGSSRSNETITREEAEATPAQTGKIPSGTGECIYIGNIRDWEAVNRRALIVEAPSRKHAYLVELVRPCFDLPFAETIAFDGGMDERLCEYGGDAVIAGRERCAIASITLIAEDTEDDSEDNVEPADEAE